MLQEKIPCSLAANVTHTHTCTHIHTSHLSVLAEKLNQVNACKMYRIQAKMKVHVSWNYVVFKPSPGHCSHEYSSEEIYICITSFIKTIAFYCFCLKYNKERTRIYWKEEVT